MTLETILSPSSSTYAGDMPAEQRNETLRSLAGEAGFDLRETILPEGTPLAPLGEQRLRAMREKVEGLPSLEDAVIILHRWERAEAPRDFPTPVQEVRMDPEGYFYRERIGKRIGMTRAGLAHVVSFLGGPTGLAGVLAELPPHTRAEAFNHFASQSGREEEVIFRTSLLPTTGSVPQRVVSAVVSDRYAPVSFAAQLDTVGSRVPAGARVKLTRTGGRLDFELLWPSMRREVRVGDAILFALRVWGSQDKSAAMGCASSFERVLCSNLTLGRSEVDEVSRVRHVGDPLPRLVEAVRNALSRLEPLIRAFGDAYKKPLPTFAPTRGEVLERVRKRFALPGRTLDRAGALWDADGEQSAGDTLAGLSNSLTRASQELTVISSQPVEEAAGTLLLDGWESIE